MSATKNSSNQPMKRVAKYLYRRGGSYTFRRAIPDYARPAFGGVREYVRSLGDVTEARAKALATVHYEFCTRRIAEARGAKERSRRHLDFMRVGRVPQREEIERAVRQWLIDMESASSLAAPDTAPEAQARASDLKHLDAEVVRLMRSGNGETPLMTRWIADALIEAQGWAVPQDGPVRSLITDRVARGQRELAARLRAELTWEDQPPPTHRMFAPHEFLRDREAEAKPEARRYVPLMEVLEGYFAEQEPAAATVKKWTTAMRALIEHLGHDDAGRVTPDDIVGWKNALLAPDGKGTRARSQMTVRHGYLGAVKPVFAWAVANKLIPANPVSGVHIAVPRRTRKRAEKGYTDAEAKRVLHAAQQIDWRSDTSFLAFARRWLPWLCAYTGARVGEMAQLRREDVAQTEDGIWYLVITPEAGTQKGGFARKVALHHHLVEQGFLEAIKARTGPLFFDPSRRRTGSTGNPQHKKVAQRVADWVRSLGLDDPELQPNHGWRHRFASVARRIKIDPDVRRAILGHAATDEHQDYGDVTVQMMHEALTAFPRFEWK
jgi:integrase